MKRYLLSLAVVVALLGACTAAPVTPVSTLTPAPTPVVTEESAALPFDATTLEDTPEVPVTDEVPVTTLVVWYPETLSPLDNRQATQLLDQQIRAFAASEENVQVEFRRKRAEDVGGIMASLRTASAVAPGALPDVTLMRRDDLITAVQAGLIQPVEGRVSSTVIGDLYDSALELGQVDGEFYGVAYMLDVLMVAYNAPEAARTQNYRWTFDAVLARDGQFALPVARASGVNDVFLLQYLAAGGALPVDNTQPLDPEALLTVFSFYEEAFEAGIIDERVLDYDSTLDYQAELISRSISAGVVTSTQYQRLRNADYQPVAGIIPTEEGSTTTLLNGWVWVIVTSNVDRQALAGRYISWMMDANRQGEYSQALEMLPSRRDTLQLWSPPDLDEAFAEDLLKNAMLSVPQGTGGVVTRAMHTALIAVVTGERTAEEAVQDALNQLAG